VHEFEIEFVLCPVHGDVINATKRKFMLSSSRVSGNLLCQIRVNVLLLFDVVKVN